MAVQVNPPPQIKVPEKWARDREISQYLANVNRMLFQLWKRTGGGQDLVSDSGDTSLDLTFLAAQNNARIAALTIGQSSTQNNVKIVTSDDTAASGDILVCINTAKITITLDASPVAGDLVRIKRKGAPVVVSGNIDGKTQKIINVKNYSMTLVFDGTEWAEV